MSHRRRQQAIEKAAADLLTPLEMTSGRAAIIEKDLAAHFGRITEVDKPARQAGLDLYQRYGIEPPKGAT